MIACEFFGAWTAKDILTVSSGLLTPFVAIIGLWIARQQWRTNHLKVQHDLYERRIAVYSTLMEILAKGKFNEAGLSAFFQKTRESYFLFGKEISDYLDLIYKKAADLQDLDEDRRNTGLAPEELHRLNVDRQNLMKWFKEQYDVAREKFSEHLKLY
jgi:hypothetical protein